MMDDPWKLLSSSIRDGKETRVLVVPNAGSIIRISSLVSGTEAMVWCPNVTLGRGKDALPALVSMR